MSREELVENFMADYDHTHMSPRRIKEELWPAMLALTEGADCHRPMGYTTPQYFPYGERWAFFYCNEVLRLTGEHLDEEDFLSWLQLVKAHVHGHAHLATFDEQKVDEMVFGLHPEYRDLVAKIYDSLFVLD